MAKQWEAKSALALAEVTGEYQPEERPRPLGLLSAGGSQAPGKWEGAAAPARGCSGRARDRLINDVVSLSRNKTGNVLQGRNFSQMLPVVCKTNGMQEPTGASGCDGGTSRRAGLVGDCSRLCGNELITPPRLQAFPSEDWSFGVCDDLQRQVGPT